MKRFHILIGIVLSGFFLVSPSKLKAQNKDVKFSLNESGENYIKFTGLAQVWLRNTQMNPGTTLNADPTSSYSDLSIRRLRFQIYGQMSERVFFYSQFGQNNFNWQSTKYTGAFFHDAVVEFAIDKERLSLGGGLAGWSGLSRYASPGAGAIMTLDAPIYQQATNGVNDQFVRKLSFYAKGQLGKLDYRLAISQPMTVTGLGTGVLAPTSTDFTFANGAPNKQYQGYFKYMFLDNESNLTPYQAGTYLGKKSVFNLGAGFIYQKDAMWAVDASGVGHSDMALFGVDVFYDKPLSENKILTVYLAYANYDFGKRYIRNIGVNNMANGSTGAAPGGFGNAFPMVGTGNTLYGQVGFLFGEDVFTTGGKLQPFATLQLSDYDYLDDRMLMYEFGLNYYLNGGHDTKLSLGYQSRPTYEEVAGETVLDTRKGLTVLQYQVSF